MKIGDMSEKDKMAGTRDMDTDRVCDNIRSVYALRPDRMQHIQSGAEDECSLARWKVPFDC